MIVWSLADCSQISVYSTPVRPSCSSTSSRESQALTCAVFYLQLFCIKHGINENIAFYTVQFKPIHHSTSDRSPLGVIYQCRRCYWSIDSKLPGGSHWQPQCTDSCDFFVFGIHLRPSRCAQHSRRRGCRHILRSHERGM